MQRPRLHVRTYVLSTHVLGTWYHTELDRLLFRFLDFFPKLIHFAVAMIAIFEQDRTAATGRLQKTVNY